MEEGNKVKGDLAKRAARLLLLKHFGKEVKGAIDGNTQTQEYGENVIKVRKAKSIIRGTIKPLENSFVNIDNIISFIESFLKLDSNYADSEEWLKSTGERIGITINKNDLEEIKRKNKATPLIKLLDSSNSKDKEYRLIINLLKEIGNELTLRHGFGTDKFGDNPSIISFLKSIKEELMNYKDDVEHLPIEGDEGAIAKVEFAGWLKEQKKNGYIKLPYYENLLADISNKGRPGKVGQVVLKGHPGTGKTSIFSYKSEKEGRPHRIISMHQYINFYELIIQNTNLSPTKNQLEFFKEVISDYESVKEKELIERLNELFSINKSNFPNNYTLIDFINTVFNISRFIKDKSKIESSSLKQEDINDHAKIQKHIIKMLNYRKDEKIYKLLIAKKESVKGEILDAMEKGENVVLDEIDKVQEKEIEGLLAFLDLNTGKYHHIQGLEEKIYIPDWFCVYATSNDKYKPAGPLGRRFNSIELQYLDKSNLAHYIAAKISNSDLTTPFSNSEMQQIILAIDIIQENQNKENYGALDFSVRMIDTFISNFVSYRNRIVEKKHTNETESYIIDALINAFESQTQDVYGGNNRGSSISDQKKELIDSIEENHMDEEKDEEGNKIIVGKRLNRSLQGKIETHIKNFGYNNPILNIIIDDKQKENEIEKRLLHYPEQTGELIEHFNKNLSRFSTNEESTYDITSSKEIDIEKDEYSITYNPQEKKLIIITNKKDMSPKKEIFICNSLYTNKSKEKFVVFGPTGDKYIAIDKNYQSGVNDLQGVLSNMNEQYGDEKIDKIFFTPDNKLIWSCHSHDTKDYLYHSNGAILEIPNIMNFKTHDGGLFFTSYDKTSGIMGGLTTANKKNKSFFKNNIEEMKVFLEFNLKDLGFENHEIQGLEFDITGRYLLIKISENGGKITTLPIKL